MERIEYLNPSLRVEYHANGVLVYRLTAFTREAIDLWAIWDMEEAHQAIASQRPSHSIVDISSAGHPSLYFTTKLEEVARKSLPNLAEKIALLVTNGVESAAQLNTLRAPSLKGKVQGFRAEAEAMDWLGE